VWVAELRFWGLGWMVQGVGEGFEVQRAPPSSGVEQTSQSRPDSGLDLSHFQNESRKAIQVVPSPLDSEI